MALLLIRSTLDGRAVPHALEVLDVTDFPAAKPPPVRAYCPGCEPHADPLQEILDVRWCDAHVPVRAGVDDALATARGTTYSNAEAGGDDNRRWCALIHRDAEQRA